MKITKQQLRQIIKEELQKDLNEDGHTDVPSSARKMKTIMEDAGQMLIALEQMGDASLPTWWLGKLAVASNDLNKLRDYLLLPSDEEEEVTCWPYTSVRRNPYSPPTMILGMVMTLTATASALSPRKNSD